VRRSPIRKAAAAPIEDIGLGRSMIEWAEELSAERVTAISSECRDGLRNTISTALGKQHPLNREYLDEIASQVGLTGRQKTALSRFRGDQEKKAERRRTKPGQVDRNVARYEQRLLRQRARTIARTETIQAAEGGRERAWTTLADQEGLGKDAVTREWSTIGAGLACPICKPMDGVTAKLGEEFTLPNGRTVMNPPAHPNCRCLTKYALKL
jgi:hypothetical protein